MGRNEPYERRELTDEDRHVDQEMLEQYRRDVAEAMKRPPVEIRSPGKFTEPLGLYEDGSFQPPLTQEEAHNEEVRRRAREEDRQAGDHRTAREGEGSE